MKNKNYSYLAPDFAPKAGVRVKNGEVTEWFKERAWKVRTPQKGVEGSNPSLSAPKKIKSNDCPMGSRLFYVWAGSFTHKPRHKTNEHPSQRVLLLIFFEH